MPLFILVPLCVLATLLSFGLIYAFVTITNDYAPRLAPVIGVGVAWMVVQVLAAGLYTYGIMYVSGVIGVAVAIHIIGSVFVFGLTHDYL